MTEPTVTVEVRMPATMNDPNNVVFCRFARVPCVDELMWLPVPTGQKLFKVVEVLHIPEVCGEPAEDDVRAVVRVVG